jgi:predicted transcriptional regulator
MNDHNDASAIIRKARQMRGITQAEFGAELQRPQSLVSKYERGLVEPPGSVVIHCMNIVTAERLAADVSTADVVRIVETHLDAPEFAKLRSAIADLIESVPTRRHVGRNQ